MARSTLMVGSSMRWMTAVALMALAMAGSGCASTKPYRTSGEPCVINGPEKDGPNPDWESLNGTRPCADRWQVSVTKPVPFSVNFVEIDEQGILASRDQAEAAIATASIAEPDGSYVVVFVHGWHHNASTNDSNVRAFYGALASVSRWNPNRKVKGIYIGWRGDSLKITGLRYATFWDRKNTSDEVGRGGLLEFLLRLEHGVKADPASHNRLVVVGHSFGASVTFNALSHLFLERFIDGVYSTADKPRFRGYGDLVVLINPAIEAMRYMPFQSALEYYSRPTTRPQADFSHETRPYLAMLSSQTDEATRLAFPAARFFSTVFEAHQGINADNSPAAAPDYSEWNMDRDTMGNFKGFKTHFPLRLEKSPSSDRQQANGTLAAGLVESCHSLKANELRRLLTIPGDDDSDTGGGVFPDSGMRVKKITRPGLDPLNGSPYIVADVHSEIVDGHTHIGSPNLLCWINQLLDTNETEERPLRSSADLPKGDLMLTDNVPSVARP